MARPTQEYQQWIDDYKEGWSTREIAEKYGASKSWVHRYLSRHLELRSASVAAHIRHLKESRREDDKKAAPM